MPKIGQMIMYRRTVCLVKDIIKNFRDQGTYYKLEPCHDPSLIIHAPADNTKKIFRPLLTKCEVEALIDSIPKIDRVEIGDKLLESTYKDLFDSEKHEDLIRIIKTSYLRNEDKQSKGQKKGEKDKMYFRKAEESLYNELAIVLDKSVADTRDYVVRRVSSLVA